MFLLHEKINMFQMILGELDAFCAPEMGQTLRAN